MLTRREEHGIGIVSWRHYWTIQERTKCEVWLFIVEGKTGLLLSQSLTVLERESRYYRGDKMDPGGMVFFDRAAFTSATEIPDVPKATVKPPGAVLQKAAPRLQLQLF